MKICETIDQKIHTTKQTYTHQKHTKHISVSILEI